MKKLLKRVAVVGALAVAFLVTDEFLVSAAEAIRARPVAGVARRTTRRVIRRTAIYVSTLPTGCQTVVVEGTTLSQCGGSYYQASGNQYVVVNVE